MMDDGSNQSSRRNTDKASSQSGRAGNGSRRDKTPSRCQLDPPDPEWEEEWVQGSVNCVWLNSVWGRALCALEGTKRHKAAPPCVQTSENGHVKTVVKKRCTSSLPGGSRPVSEASRGESCEEAVQQLHRDETPSLVKPEVPGTTAENSEEDHPKTRREQVEADHQEVLLKKEAPERQQFIEELLEPEEDAKLLAEVNTLKSSLDETEAKVHHLQKEKQDLVQRLERYQGRAQQLEGHIAELRKKHVGLGREIQHLKERNHHLTVAIQRSAARLDDLLEQSREVAEKSCLVEIRQKQLGEEINALDYSELVGEVKKKRAFFRFFRNLKNCFRKEKKEKCL